MKYGRTRGPRSDRHSIRIILLYTYINIYIMCVVDEIENKKKKKN